MLAGGPLPRLVRVTDTAVETLDLDRLSRDDPAFHPGATVALLARGAQQVMVVARLSAPDLPEQALLFDAGADTAARWWAATLAYRRDPTTGLSTPTRDWATTPETDQPAELPEVLRPWVTDAGGGRPARFAPPDPMSEVLAAFGSLPARAKVPTDARTLTHLAAALTLEDLLHGRIRGSVVVRVAGRDWESWVVGDDLCVQLDDAIRAIANHGTRAEAVALIHLALYDDVDPPRPGLQCVAQHGDERLESWSMLTLPDGPGGPMALGGGERWRHLPPACDDGWLRPPASPIDLIALGCADA